MDVTLVQDAEHDVHHHDCDHEQHGEVRQRALKRLRGALELPAHRFRQRLGRHVAHAAQHAAERRAGRQPE